MKRARLLLGVSSTVLKEGAEKLEMNAFQWALGAKKKDGVGKANPTTDLAVAAVSLALNG